MRKLLLIVILFSFLKSDAQNPMFKLIGKQAQQSFLLDTYTGALGAYSLRQLRAAQTLCIRARRGGDNAEQDIGFVAGVLDVTSLTSFIGGIGGNGDGFIVKWYDQSGNGNDLSQAASPGNQPFIIISGTLQTVNGKPAVNFGTEANEWYFGSPTGFLNAVTSVSYFQVAEITAFGGSNAAIIGPTNTGGVGFEVLQHDVISRPSLLRFNGTARNDNGGAAYQLWDNATQSLTSIFGNSTDVTAYKNSGAVTLTNSGAMPALNFNGVYGVGQYNSAGNDMNGKIQELIIYSSNETANRTGIESNINLFYSIY